MADEAGEDQVHEVGFSWDISWGKKLWEGRLRLILCYGCEGLPVRRSSLATRGCASGDLKMVKYTCVDRIAYD